MTRSTRRALGLMLALVGVVTVGIALSSMGLWALVVALCMATLPISLFVQGRRGALSPVQQWQLWVVGALLAIAAGANLLMFVGAIDISELGLGLLGAALFSLGNLLLQGPPTGNAPSNTGEPDS